MQRARFLPSGGIRFVAPGSSKPPAQPLAAGRDFTWTDLYENRHVAMVSENMAREMWGDPSAASGQTNPGRRGRRPGVRS